MNKYYVKLRITEEGYKDKTDLQETTTVITVTADDPKKAEIKAKDIVTQYNNVVIVTDTEVTKVYN